MARSVGWILIVLSVGGVGLCAAGVHDTPAVHHVPASPAAGEILKREHLVRDVRFQVPLRVWQAYAGAAPDAPPPVHGIAERGRYHVSVDDAGKITLEATVRYRVLHAADQALPAVPSVVHWESITLNGQAAALPDVSGWRVIMPDKPGIYTVTARAKGWTLSGGRGRVSLPRAATLVTELAFDSPAVCSVSAGDAARVLTGRAGGGTRGTLSLRRGDLLSVQIGPVKARQAKGTVVRVDGAVAWDLAAAGGRITAALDVAILGDPTDQLTVTLPGGARRIHVTGPDVREVRPAGARAVVFLRREIAGRTRLMLTCELPPRPGERQTFGGLGVSGGRWSGGTVVVSSTAGSGEILEGGGDGLTSITLQEVSPQAAGISPAAPVLAWRVTGGQWSAAVDVLKLGQYALRESVADLAHFQVAAAGDGTLICRANYEIRNRNRQFLRVHLPANSRVLLARVAEKSVPLTAARDVRGGYLMPLARSKPSVKGLVTFPVELVFMYRTGNLAGGRAASLTLPRIDLPIAYAWCETYLPRPLKLVKTGGTLKRVQRYSSETAVASLDYGRGEMAEGYREKDRHRPKSEPKVTQPGGKPGDGKKGGGWLGALLNMPLGASAPMPSEKPKAPPPIKASVAGKKPKLKDGKASAVRADLAANYYRTGKELYDNNRFAEAEKALKKAADLSPKSTEGANARRLLANIRVVQGKGKLATKGEKLAAKYVTKGVSRGNLLVAEQQKVIIDKGFELAKKGKRAEAAKQFQAAEALGEQLVEQGEGKDVQERLLKGARQQLSIYKEDVRKEQSSKLDKVRELRRRGRYEEALDEARELSGDDKRFAWTRSRVTTSDFADATPDADGGGGGGGGERDGLRKELEELTLLAARQRARRLRPVTAPGGPSAPATQPAEQAQQLRDQLRDMDEVAAPLRRAAAAAVARPGVAPQPDDELDEPFARHSGRVNVLSRGGQVRDVPPATDRPVPATVQPADRTYRLRLLGDNRIDQAALADRALRPPSPPAGQGQGRGTGAGITAPARRDERMRPRSGRPGEPILGSTPAVGNLFGRGSGTGLGRKGPGTDGPPGAVSELERRRVAARQISDVEINKALEHSNRMLGRGEQAEDFLSAANSTQTAMKLLEANRGLYTQQDYATRRATIEKQLTLLHVRRDRWQQQRAGRQMTQMQRIETAQQIRGLERSPLPAQVAGGGALPARLPQPPRQPVAGVAGTIVSEVPWERELTYPRAWSEPTERRRHAAVTAGDNRDTTRAVRRRMKERINELDFDQIELENVVQFLRDVSGVNIYVKWNALKAAGINPDTPVNVHLQDVSVEKALRVILEDVGASAPLGYVVTGEGDISISTRDDLASRTVTRVYDIRDLIVRPPSFAGPRLGVVAGEDQTEQQALEQVPSEEVANDIVKLIKTTVASDSWKDTNRRGIQVLRGQLVVSQDSQSHEQITDVLSRLREARALQVTVEARFIDADKLPEHLLGPPDLPADAGGNGSSGIGLDIAEGGVPTAFEVTNTFLDDAQVDFVVKATQANAVSRVLTAPRMTLFNGQRSYIAVTQDQAYLSDFSLSREVVDPNTAETRQVADPAIVRLRTGTVLDVQATISDDRRHVTLTLRPQFLQGLEGDLTVRDYANQGNQTVQAIELPTTLDSELETTVSVPDGGTILLRGRRNGRQFAVLVKPRIVIQSEQEGEGPVPLHGDAGSAARLRRSGLSREVVDPNTQATGQSRTRPVATTHWNVLREYDVRDLLIDTTTAADNGGNLTDALARQREASQKKLDELTKKVQDTLQAGGRSAESVRVVNGRLQVTGDLQTQRFVGGLVKDLRAARGPQVQRGRLFAGQQALVIVEHGQARDQAALDEDLRVLPALRNVWTLDREVVDPNTAETGTIQAGTSPRLQEFLVSNYKWHFERVADEKTAARTASALTDRLRSNLGQKVPVGSININGDAQDAASLGITFQPGANGLNVAVIDEAQFRTLMQVDRRRAQAGSVVDNNLSGQETIVGTNALLANGMVAKVAYAADKGNTLTVQDNSIHVPHGQYVLIDNGTFLTAVRAEAMRHWTAPRESIVFAEAPQNIDIPRLGPVYRFERTLLKANDTLVIQLSYQWEGDAK